jgi:DNA-damage-inducible protein D
MPLVLYRYNVIKKMVSKVNLSPSTFEKIKQIDDSNEEYWYARELMQALGYATWESFHKVIKKAITSMLEVYPQVEEHFREVTKKYRIAAGTANESVGSMKDYKLTRYACYLIAQNGSSAKKEIAHAQSYFAMQTRKQELEDEKGKAIERILARQKLRETEKKFSGVLKEKGLSGFDIAEIRSVGDESLFGAPTREIKEKLNIKQDALADHLPTITIKAKELATEITTFNTKQKNLRSKDTIRTEHSENNSSVRKLLNEKGIYPENLPPEIDVKKLEKRLSEEELKDIKSPKYINIEEISINLVGISDTSELQKVKELIDRNKGDSILKIIYGTEKAPKTITKYVNFNRFLMNGLRRYIVVKS